MVFRESRVVDDVWAGVAPRALAGEALLIVLDNFEYDVVVASQGSLERRRRTQKYRSRHSAPMRPAERSEKSLSTQTRSWRALRWPT